MKAPRKSQPDGSWYLCIGLTSVPATSSLLRCGTNTKYVLSLSSKMNSSAMALRIRSLKSHVATSHLQPNQSKTASIRSRGNKTKATMYTLVNFVTPTTANSCVSSPSSFVCMSAWAMDSIEGVATTKRWNMTIVLLMSPTQVSVQMNKMTKMNLGFDSGIRQTSAFTSASKSAKLGRIMAPTPRRFPVSEFFSVVLYMCTSNASYASRMSCTALAVT
mmetsp:Transcript_33441/g.92427  ORF Transcript_33441/g.92427 Transcript_33441/m.92427 type:complete len:218 (+) Transcript_33441:205-858(+)